MLADTLSSVLACDPGPAEIIVVDGDSAQSARPVLAAVADCGAPEIRYLAADVGLTRQRNLGLAAASADVVLFLDDDVTVPRETFRVLEEAYRDETVIGATGRVVGDRCRVARESLLRRLLPGGGREGSFTRYGYPRYIHRVDRPLDVDFMHGCFMSARRYEATSVGFDEMLLGYALAEDEDFSLRLARRGRVRYIPELVVEHRLAPRERASSRSLDRMLVVNRTYLFRKNFDRTLLSRVQFAGLVAALAGHRLLMRDLDGVRGLVEGAAAALRGGRPHSSTNEPSIEHVAFVSSGARHGGSERYLEWLLEAIEPDWVRVVVSLEEGALPDRSRAIGHPTVVIPTGRRRTGLVGAAWRLRRVLRSTRPSVVHANGIKAAVVAGAAALGTGIPVVWLKVDFYRDGPVSALLARTCAQVIGVSESVIRTFGSRYDGKVHVVNSGIPAFDVDREHARSVVLDHSSEPAPEEIVTLVGRLAPDKGHLEVLEVIPTVLAHRPRARFLFVGGDDARSTPYGRTLIRRVRELGLEQSVSFLPHRADATTLMAGSDLLVHASVLTAGVRDTEGLPLVALESMLAKTPVVGYANGGLPELLADCGRIVPRGDRAALAKAILELLGDDALRAHLGERGRERVLARFLLPANVEAMKERYRAAAGRAEGGGSL